MTNKRLGFLIGIYFGGVVALTAVIVSANMAFSGTEAAETTTTIASEEPAAAPVMETASCAFSDWVGQSAQDVKKLVEATDRSFRMLPPGSAMTMDYRPDRINIELDDNNIVVRVFCG